MKVDFTCFSPPTFSLVSPLNSRLLRLCRSVLCGGDNGSNYTGSVSVFHSTAAAAAEQADRRWHRGAMLPGHIRHALWRMAADACTLSHRREGIKTVFVYQGDIFVL